MNLKRFGDQIATIIYYFTPQTYRVTHGSVRFLSVFNREPISCTIIENDTKSVQCRNRSRHYRVIRMICRFQTHLHFVMRFFTTIVISRILRYTKCIRNRADMYVYTTRERYDCTKGRNKGLRGLSPP